MGSAIVIVVARSSLLLLFLVISLLGQKDESSGEQPALLRMLIIILHNDNSHHITNARLTRSYLYSQRESVAGRMRVEVILSHEEWPSETGVWTVFPVIDDIAEHYSSPDGFHWILFMQEHTEINLLKLHEVLTRFNSEEPIFLGRGLRDQRASIIHHFAYHEDPQQFSYPDFASGFVMSSQLIAVIAERKTPLDASDFAIDPKHELAKDLLETFDVSLMDVKEFCSPIVQSRDGCATYYNTKSLQCAASSTHKAVTEDNVFILVKTCENFHLTRVPLQKKLWTNRVKNLEYCSEKYDASIPTVDLNIKNTERGHCKKLWTMIYRAHNSPHINTKDWLVIVDDDTILSVPRLLRVLTCYNPTDMVALGEKYGYGVRRKSGSDYITGGGGIVLSMKTVHALIREGIKCRQDDSPDDMMLGSWLKRLDIPISHSPLFHQASPKSYAPEYLLPQKETAVSFHKYSDDDPDMVAKEWLGLEPSVRDEL